MEHYNFEEQLERKLNTRSITPSENAWERIAYNRKLQKRNRRKAFAYWIAAAVVIVLGTFSILLQQKTTVIENRVVLKEIPMVPKALPQMDKSSEMEVVATEAVAKSHPFEKHQNIAIPEEVPVGVTQIVSDLETKKIEEVVTTLAEMTQSGAPISKNEIDALLEKAQNNIAIERAANKNQPLTSSDNLLDDAEKEVDKTFKEKVFDLFHHKFRTVKIALGDN
ncbi:MAG: hypothetical protein PSV16_04895 [Flavobacterium sp.]|nr:hypothetical protein [Flavobacterium sp.]